MATAVPFKAFAVWLLILAFAVANGALREGLLLELLPRSSAFAISGLLLIACILAISFLFIRWFAPLTLTHCVLIGILWLVLTLIFEFGFGLARGQTLSSLLEGYRFKDGNIWPIALLVVALAPTIAAVTRGLVSLRGSR